jgi:RNA polymerase sigma factor (sigma-70 family)
VIATRADIEAVAPLIRREVTYRFRRAPEWIDRDDLVQEAMVAVCTAAWRWEPAKGAFSTFAGHRAIGGVLDYLRDERPGTRKHPQKYPLSLDHEYTAPGGGRVSVANLFPVYDPQPADDVLRKRLFAEVDKLPEDTARVFRLCVEAEMTQVEVADLEGVSRSHICRRIADARRRMLPMARLIVGRE